MNTVTMNPIISEPRRDTWPRLLERPSLSDTELEATVAAILKDVQQKGDEALKTYSLQFDGFADGELLVSPAEISAAAAFVDKDLKKAIRIAKKNIEKFHKTQQEKMIRTETMPGVLCWRKSIALNTVGLYIPGGTAPLFSTLLMLGIPARIAGCKNIIVCTPPGRGGKINASILFVAKLLGISKIYKLGGAQAIGAMSYGTPTVEKADKVFGPGNQFVTCAKKLVSRQGTAIDMLAGPSELAVYCDETSIPAFVASDLLSQCEHGHDSQVVVVSTRGPVAEKVMDEVQKQKQLLPRKDIISASLLHSRFVVFARAKDAFDFINEYAPEHLIIASRDSKKLAKYVQNAGSVFLGSYSPESAGDYASGTNHSLPTNGYAKAHSGLSVDSFVKKITFQKINKKGIRNIGPTVEAMALGEGLYAHKNAVSIRLKKILS
jgi:histidinol dehydrogenase